MTVHIGFLEKSDSLLGFQYKLLELFEGKDYENVKLNTYYQFSIGILFARIVIEIPGSKRS